MDSTVTVRIRDSIFGEVKRRHVVVLEVIGPFSLHASVDAVGKYTVTHTATGYATKARFLNLPCARKYAKALLPLADWGFIDPEAPKHWPLSLVEKLRGLSSRFMRDDMLRDWPTPPGSEG